MGKTVIALSEQEVIELQAILMDEDGKEDLAFLKHRILEPIHRAGCMSKERRIFS